MSTETSIATPPPSSAKMTYDEFLDWHPDSGLAEWVDGEAFIMPPPSTRHQDVIRFLSFLLNWFAESKNLGRVFFAPLQMRLAHSGREPDILFVSIAHQDRFRELYIDGPADLVVEVVSPSGRKRDQVEKFREYQEAGIAEYWIVDPLRREAAFYTLTNGAYSVLAQGSSGVVHSKVLEGFWLRIEWLWQEPLPNLADVLKEWDARS